jgi:alpha,alpha-trehalase
MQFVADLEPNQDGALQIMYGIDGRRDLTESTRDDMSGYAGARPVRIGNGAFDQRQNDVFGAVLDSILLHVRRGDRLPRRLWPIVKSQAECATAVWREPDQGIWEARGKPQHYVSSKLMGWVALDRASKLADIRGDRDLAAIWGATAAEIKDDILAHGVDGRGVLRQHYDTDALDASARSSRPGTSWSACCGSPRRWGSSPRSLMSTPGGISATSRRPSPTSP